MQSVVEQSALVGIGIDAQGWLAVHDSPTDVEVVDTAVAFADSAGREIAAVQRVMGRVMNCASVLSSRATG